MYRPTEGNYSLVGASLISLFHGILFDYDILIVYIKFYDTKNFLPFPSWFFGYALSEEFFCW